MSASDNLFTLWGRLASTIRLAEGSWTFSLAVATADGRVNYPLITMQEEPSHELIYHDATPLERQMWVGVVGQVKTHNVEHSVLSYIRYILGQVGAGSYGDLFNVLLPAEIAQRLVKEVKYEFRVQPGKVFVELSENDRPGLTNFFMLRGRLASPVRRRSDLWVCTLAVTEQTRVVDYPTITLGMEEPPADLVYHKGQARRHQPLLRVVGELGTRRTRRTALNYIRYILRRVRASDSADLFEMFLPIDVGRRIIRETEYNLLVDAEKIVIEKQAPRPGAAVSTRVLSENSEVAEVADEVPGAEDKVSGAEDKVPGAEDKVPGAEDKVPGAEDKVPGAEDKVPGAEDEVPEAEDEVPEVENEVLEVEDKVPGAEDKVSGAEDEVPEAEDEVLEVEDEVPGAEDKVSGAEDKVPEAEDEVPEAEDEVLEVKDEVPGVEDEVPGVEDEVPGVEDEIPEVKNEVLEVENEVLEVENEVPEVAGEEVPEDEGETT